jgi:hypothetical protein
MSVVAPLALDKDKDVRVAAVSCCLACNCAGASLSCRLMFNRCRLMFNRDAVSCSTAMQSHLWNSGSSAASHGG